MPRRNSQPLLKTIRRPRSAARCDRRSPARNAMGGGVKYPDPGTGTTRFPVDLTRPADDQFARRARCIFSCPPPDLYDLRNGRQVWAKKSIGKLPIIALESCCVVCLGVVAAGGGFGKGRAEPHFHLLSGRDHARHATVRTILALTFAWFAITPSQGPSTGTGPTLPLAAPFQYNQAESR